MRRSRQVIAIVVLASALAADGALNAAPVKESSATAPTLAGRLVQRISVGLRRTITAAHFVASRQPRNIAIATPLHFESQLQRIAIRPSLLLPTQLHLPPPTV